MSEVKPPLFVRSDVDDAQLSAPAFRLLCHLYRRAGADGLIYSGVEDMAKVCRLEIKTIRAALQTLEKRNIITTIQRPGLTWHRRINQVEAWLPNPTQKATPPEQHPHQGNGSTPLPNGPSTPHPNGTHKGTPLKVLQEKEIHNDAEFPEILNTEDFKREFSRWIEHLKQKGHKATPMAVEEMLRKCEAIGRHRAIEMIR